MLFNLSLKNIKKSIKDYSIYFFTLVVAVAIFYLFNSIDAQKSMLVLTNSKADMIKSLVMIISYVSVFVSVILGFLIIYSNNFLIKRRKKEIGLYLTLGMSKRKVSTILVMETLLVGILSLVVGLICGVFLSQLLSLFTAKLFEVDMSSFKFVFSSEALIKTILYFGIIFVLVMIFNVITLGRYQLIDLLNANKKNEKVKVRNKYVTIISFILTFIFLGYAYHLLFSGALRSLDNTMLIMILSGSIGTFLLFFSISGVLLQIVQKNKKLYYKNLNMFVLRQVNSRINTTVISTTVITLMLFFTIGILSGSMSMANAFNTGLKENNLSDFTITADERSYVIENGEYKQIPLDQIDMNSVINNDEFKNDVKEYVSFNKYNSDITVKDLLTNESKTKLVKKYGSNVSLDFKVPIIKESDYKALMKLFGKKAIEIKDNEYLLMANIDLVLDSYKSFYEKNSTVNINGIKLYPATDHIDETAIENNNSNGNDGVIVVSDEIANNLPIDVKDIIGNYVNTNDINKLDTNFQTSLKDIPVRIRTKLDMEAASVGIKAMMTFIGLYLGIIFAISSVTILAIGQLSESSDNKERYNVLRKIGTDEKMLDKALLTQIAITFMLPLIVALFHAFFGLKELNGLIQLFGSIDLTKNIFITTIFIVIIYGGYFIATYLASKNIIKEK